LFYYNKINTFIKIIFNGDWGLGIGDWGLGIGPNAQSPIPNPHLGIIPKNILFNNLLKKIINF